LPKKRVPAQRARVFHWGSETRASRSRATGKRRTGVSATRARCPTGAKARHARAVIASHQVKVSGNAARPRDIEWAKGGIMKALDTAMRSPSILDARPTADAALARRVAAGDRSAFVAMMRRYNQTLFRTARSILKDDAEAEDAVQEAWLRAHRSIGGFRADAKLSTWLVRIVANEAFARLRKRRRHGEVVALHLDADGEDSAETTMGDQPRERPDGQALRSELRRLLEARLDELPSAFRAVFVLRAIEEMSVDEVAASLGIPAATVRSRFFRARGLLRDALASEIDFDVDDLFAFAGARCDRIVAGVIARLDPA
jgi:RNA polymerase sigma-70 factor, ECF subfamily